MIELLKQVFTPDKFTIKATTIPNQYEISKKDSEIDFDHCLTILVNKDYIDLDLLSKCGINNGNRLLHMLDDFARLINLHKITLMDKSNIYICDVKIKLSDLYILTTGESWYNAHGYYSADSKSENDNNKTILIKDMDDYVKECIDMEFIRYENELNMPQYRKNAIIYTYNDKSYKKTEEFIEKYNNMKSYETDPVKTMENIKTKLDSYLPQIKAKFGEYFKKPKYLVHEFFKVIKEILKNSRCDTDKNEIEIISKFITLCSIQIKYDGDELTKDLSAGLGKGKRKIEKTQRKRKGKGKKRKSQGKMGKTQRKRK